jgi:hypothetical protein
MNDRILVVKCPRRKNIREDQPIQSKEEAGTIVDYILRIAARPAMAGFMNETPCGLRPADSDIDEELLLVRFHEHLMQCFFALYPISYRQRLKF